MNIDFTARRLKLDPRVRELVETKLSKLERVLPPDAQAHVIVKSEKKGVSVEVTVVGRQRTWTATEGGPDQESAVHAVLERIAAQAKKTKAKVKEEKKKQGRGTLKAVEAWTGPAEAAEVTVPAAPRPPKAERIVARPTFEEDAVHKFQKWDRQIMVYRDPTDDSLRILYRRRDGSLGIVVPV
jgi:putative sigma-54 modulation protein